MSKVSVSFEDFKNELETQGYNVIIPEFPIKESININAYFQVLDMYKEIINENYYLVFFDFALDQDE